MNALTRIEHSPGALIPYDEIERMGSVIARSGLFGVKTTEQAIALMLIAQAEGLHPAIAARDYHVINNRPCLRSDAMLARFQQSGGKVSWEQYTDEVVTGTFSHPIGGSVSVTWTIEMARKAKLAGKEVWQAFPRQMLRARCISEGIRTVFPGVVSGMYAPEEIQDIMEGPVVTSAAVADAQSKSRSAELKAKINESLIKAGALPAIVPGEPFEVDPDTGLLIQPGALVDLLASISAAPHKTALKTLKPKVVTLDEPWQSQAKSAYNARLTEFSEGPANE
jgi:hypothetical protein